MSDELHHDEPSTVVLHGSGWREQMTIELGPPRDPVADVELVLTLSADTLSLDEHRPDLASRRVAFEQTWSLLLLHAHAGYGELDERVLRRASALLLADAFAPGVPVRCPDCGIVWFTQTPFDWSLVGAEPAQCFECMLTIEGKVVEAVTPNVAIEAGKTTNGRKRRPVATSQREAEK